MILLFGPAGSGKSTQGRSIADLYGWRWLSVGQVLRDTGEFDDILKVGGLVEDEKVVELMDRQIAMAEAEGMDVILDGYPRDVKQTEIMQKAESDFFDKIEGAIVLEVPKEVLLERIELRGRNDDTSEVVKKRIDIFEQNICSILPLLESKKVPIFRVDGVGSYEEVGDRIKEVLEGLKPGTPEVFFADQENSIENDAVEREKSYGE